MDAWPGRKSSGYNKRVRAETAMARFKQVMSDGLRSPQQRHSAQARRRMPITAPAPAVEA